MAIQVIQASPRRRRESFGSRLGKALGEGLRGGLEIYQENQRQKQAEQKSEQEYQQENETYRELTGGRNLSRNPKIREMEIEYALKGQHQAQGEQFKSYFQQEKEQQKYKTKSQEFADKLAGEQKVQKELVSFADRLEQSNPDNPSYKALADIYRADIPMNTKTEIVKSLTGSDPFKQDQQNRLQMDSVLKRYNSRLKELDNEIKNVQSPSSTGKEEVNALRKQRMALRNERDQLLDFRALNGMDEMEDETEDEAEEEIADEGTGKVRFNPANKGHRAKAEQLFKKFKDKEKVRKILAKEFEGL